MDSAAVAVATAVAVAATNRICNSFDYYKYAYQFEGMAESSSAA